MTETAAKTARPEPSRAPDWLRLYNWFQRLLGLGWLALGVMSWALIFSAPMVTPTPFEDQATIFQTLTVFFAVIDVLAAVGLWLLSPWGGVVWRIAAVSRLAASFVFPAEAVLSLTALLLIAACLLLDLTLAILVSRSQP